MKSREWKQESVTQSEGPNRIPGCKRARIVIENIWEDRAEPSDGVGLQMTLLFFSSRAYRFRASNFFIAQFYSIADGVSRARPFCDREVIRNPEAWLVKVVCTLFFRSHSLNACFGYLSRNLNPSIAFEVIKRFRDPLLGLKFFEFSRTHLSINHTFNTYDLLVRNLCQMGLNDSAKTVFDCMRTDGILPDSSIVEILVSSYARLGKLDAAKNFLDEIHCYGIKVSPFVYNNFLNMLVKQNQVDEAVLLFREHLEPYFTPDVYTFNILIRGLCRIGETDKAFEYLQNMENFGCFPDIVSYNTLINGFCRV
ncbi:pentatricopeptide repeat-containing protein At2g06000-like, partial [Cucurbita pepo subsp. pepo]